MNKSSFFNKLGKLESIYGNHQLFDAVKRMYSVCFESSMEPDVRKYTNRLLDMLSRDELSYEEVCKECLAEMSEDAVERMCNDCEYCSLDYSPDPRQYTNKVLELIDDGVLSYEDVCKECLAEMSEDQVEDMCRICEWGYPDNTYDDEDDDSDVSDVVDEILEEMSDSDDLDELNDVVNRVVEVDGIEPEQIARVIHAYIRVSKQIGESPEVIDINVSVDPDNIMFKCEVSLHDFIKMSFIASLPYESVYRKGEFKIARSIASDSRFALSNINTEIGGEDVDLGTNSNDILKYLIEDSPIMKEINETIEYNVNDMVN